jgi:ankyrin repeat protein
MRDKILGVGSLWLALILMTLSPVMAQEGAKLIESVWSQDFDRAKELVKGGVDVNYQDPSSGSTALMLACGYNFADMARFLVEHGADLNRQDKQGQTALMIAAYRSEEIFTLLLSKGADIKVKDKEGRTAFTHAWVGVLSEEVPLAVVETLLNKGADVNEAPDRGPAEGYTCLMMASGNNRPGLVSFLIGKGADVNARARDGKTALGLAQEEGHSEVVKLLIAAGAKG